MPKKEFNLKKLNILTMMTALLLLKTASRESSPSWTRKARCPKPMTSASPPKSMKNIASTRNLEAPRKPPSRRTRSSKTMKLSWSATMLALFAIRLLAF